jgi:hypothetical protein
MACDTACLKNAVCAAGACKGTVTADGTDCGTLAAPAMCVSAVCKPYQAKCEVRKYGANFAPTTTTSSWEEANFTQMGDGTICECFTDGSKIYGPHDKPCNSCGQVAVSYVEGGSSNPDGITTSVYGCF